MKICPICKQNFPNGFQYCPNDSEQLLTPEDFQRLATQVQTTVTTVETFPPEPAVNSSRPNLEIITSTKIESGPVKSDETRPFPRPVSEPSEPNLSQAYTTKTSVFQDKYGDQSTPTRSTPRTGNVAPNVLAGSTKTTQTRGVTELTLILPESESLFSRLRAGVKSYGEVRRSGYTGTTAGTGFQFLLDDDSFFKRINQEFRAAFAELQKDPLAFLVSLLRGEGLNLGRRNMLLVGSEVALVGIVTLYFTFLAFSSAVAAPSGIVRGLTLLFAFYLVGCFIVRVFMLRGVIKRATLGSVFPKVLLEIANWTPLALIFVMSILLSNNYQLYCTIFPKRCSEPEKPIEELNVIAELTNVPTDIGLKVEKAPLAKERKIGGSLNKPKAASGGGGGGRSAPTPPSRGVPPPMALTPQIVMPNPEPPKIKDPSLAVAPTIYGDPRALPPMKGPIGDPMGVPAPPSSGPGTGAGIGRGTGTGVGGGEGGGAGQGRGGNAGGGDIGLGGGRSVEPMTRGLSPTILYKEKAKYTEEARQNKIQGTVVLSVVFTYDGRITNIKVVRGLPDGLTEKAIEAAQRIRFNPAVRAGAPVSVRGNLEFTFNLY